MKEKDFSCILWDVDGTLVDSANTIIDALLLTLTELGLPSQSREQLRRYIGPPMWESFKELGIAEDDRAQAITTYRSHYIKNRLHPQAYPGIESVLIQLKDARIPMVTATSKQQPMAQEQLSHLGLDRYFHAIVGATPDPGCTKEVVVRRAIDELAYQGIDTSLPVLIGDRIWDVNGAHAQGIPVIGVSWGYSEEGELSDANIVVDNTEDLLDILLR